jgi:hypothetical protein
VQRHDQGGGISASRIRATGAFLLTAHLLFVCWLTLRPRSVPWVSPSNLHPFATIRADLAGGPAAALEGIGGGLLLLAPLGVLLPLACGRLHRSLWCTATRTALAGLLISLALALLGSGVPGRVVNVDVVMLNAVGVLMAFLAVFLPLRARLRRTAAEGGGGAAPAGAALPPEPGRLPPREETGAGATPRTPRVRIAP